MHIHRAASLASGTLSRGSIPTRLLLRHAATCALLANPSCSRMCSRCPLAVLGEMASRAVIALLVRTPEPRPVASCSRRVSNSTGRWSRPGPADNCSSSAHAMAPSISRSAPSNALVQVCACPVGGLDVKDLQCRNTTVELRDDLLEPWRHHHRRAGGDTTQAITSRYVAARKGSCRRRSDNPRASRSRDWLGSPRHYLSTVVAHSLEWFTDSLCPSAMARARSLHASAPSGSSEVPAPIPARGDRVPGRTDRRTREDLVGRCEKADRSDTSSLKTS